MTHSRFQSRLLLSPHLHTTLSLATSLFVHAHLNLYVSVVCVPIEKEKEWEGVCVYARACFDHDRGHSWCENPKEAQECKGEGEKRLHSDYMLLFRNDIHKHTCTLWCTCCMHVSPLHYLLCTPAYTHIHMCTLADTYTVTHRNCSVSVSQGNVSTWQSKNVFLYKHYHLSFVNDFSILKGTAYTSTNQINPSLQPGLIICPISALFVINWAHSSNHFFISPLIKTDYI